MARTAAVVTASILIAATSACTKPAASAARPAPPSEAEAGRVVDRVEAAWSSMDAAKIKALYAPDIVGFDLAVAPLATDRATWDSRQDAFAAARFDRIAEKSRKIQILGPDVFVMSGFGDITGSAVPANDAALRYTDVFRRQAGGGWLIVNEHVSVAPEG